MDMNDYCVEVMARERLRDLRAEASAVALRTVAQPGTPLRVSIGRALVRLGNRLMSGAPPVRATA